MDTKASILCVSENISHEVRTIYEEIYLCSSNLSLAIIKSLIERTNDLGGINFVHNILTQINDRVETIFRDTPLKILNSHKDSIMSIVWIDITKTNMNDLEFINLLSKYSISVLPGRYFYWSSYNDKGHNFIRIALLKPYDILIEGLYKIIKVIE